MREKGGVADEVCKFNSLCLWICKFNWRVGEGRGKKLRGLLFKIDPFVNN